MKETRAFGEMVREHGRKLRQIDYRDLAGTQPMQPARINIGRRTGYIECICQLEGERIAVVVRGKIDTWLPWMKRIYRDGFFKYPDGSLADIPVDMLYNYDPLLSD